MLPRRNKYKSVSLESPPTSTLGAHIFFPPVRPTSFSSSATHIIQPTSTEERPSSSPLQSHNVLICVSYSGCSGGRCYYFVGSLVAPISLARSAYFLSRAHKRGRPQNFHAGEVDRPEPRNGCATRALFYLFSGTSFTILDFPNTPVFTFISLGILLRMISHSRLL